MTTHLHGLKDRCILGLRGLALDKEEEVGDPQSLVEQNPRHDLIRAGSRGGGEHQLSVPGKKEIQEEKNPEVGKNQAGVGVEVEIQPSMNASEG